LRKTVSFKCLLHTLYWQHLRSCLPLQAFERRHCGQDNRFAMEN